MLGALKFEASRRTCVATVRPEETMPLIESCSFNPSGHPHEYQLHKNATDHGFTMCPPLRSFMTNAPNIHERRARFHWLFPESFLPRMSDLQDRLKSLVAQSKEPSGVNQGAARDAVADLVRALNAGDVRAAAPTDDGTWETNAWVKEGILLGFRIGRTVDYSSDQFPFYDKDTFPVKPLRKADDVRLVPGGSSIRTGSYTAPGVVCMPPMYVNVGAYVDEETMIDSHALVGSCAQIGKRVHLSAAAQVGGVLEPVHATPVIVEDDVFVGGNAGLYEGCVVREGAVLAAGVTLTASTRLYDLEKETVYTADDGSLEVPAGAVVVPGSRSVDSDFGQKHGLSLSAPVIVKYRDADTDAATVLEDALR